MNGLRTQLLFFLLLGGLALSWPHIVLAEPRLIASSAASEHRPDAPATQTNASLADAQTPGWGDLPPPSPTGEAPPGGEGASTLTVMVRMILVLLGVLLLAYLLLHKGLGSLSKKLSQGRLVRVVERVGLEPKKSLYVVEVTGRYYLIGTSDNGVSCLATLDSPEAKQAFAQVLGRHQGAATGPATPSAELEGEAHVKS